MPEQVLAAVHTGEKRLEIREFPMPDVAPDCALLKVEAAGMCSAYSSYSLAPKPAPLVLGHENAGTLVKVGKVFAQRWGVEEGDFISLEEYIPCYHCEECLNGEYRHCYDVDGFHNDKMTRFGATPISKEPSLWGGYAQYLYLPINVAMQKMPRTVRPEVAAFMLPLANGVQWGVKQGHAGPGKTVLVQGPGPKGLGCVIAAKLFGASNIIVSGLNRDKRRLEVAQALGADHIINFEEEDLLDKVMEYTDGVGVDVSLDCTRTTTQQNIDNAAKALRRKNGIVVLPHGFHSPADKPIVYPL